MVAKVEDETLLKLAQAAITAPNGGNAQPWDFVFVTDAALVGKLRDMVASVQNAPAFVLVCLNIVRNQQLNEPYGEWTFKWANHSVAAAMENLILAAVAEGLGTCWLGAPSWRSGSIKELLNIPVNVEIVAMSPIGYPDEAPKARPRLPVGKVTHFNTW
jgi:nitroreductase